MRFLFTILFFVTTYTYADCQTDFGIGSNEIKTGDKLANLSKSDYTKAVEAEKNNEEVIIICSLILNSRNEILLSIKSYEKASAIFNILSTSGTCSPSFQEAARSYENGLNNVVTKNRNFSERLNNVLSTKCSMNLI